jgi:hypothetical protein
VTATAPAMERRRTPGRLEGLWARWVGANAVAELVGLGTAAVVAAVVVTRDDPTRAAVLLAALALVAAGGVEGVAVGVAQGRVLRRALPPLRLRSWVAATLAGTLVAWTLGMLPSTVMATTAGPAEPPFSDAVQLVLAAALGVVAGVVLGVPQWLVLRRHVARAGWWIPANSLAWGAGMPMVFAVAGGLPEGSAPAVIVGIVVATLLTTGAVVGAVHGAVLMRLLRAGPPAGQRP